MKQVEGLKRVGMDDGGIVQLGVRSGPDALFQNPAQPIRPAFPLCDLGADFFQGLK